MCIDLKALNSKKHLAGGGGREGRRKREFSILYDKTRATLAVFSHPVNTSFKVLCATLLLSFPRGWGGMDTGNTEVLD